MNNLLCLPLFVLILIFDSVNNSKGEHINVSLTTTKQTWFQARNKCPLIGNEHTNINISTVNSNDSMWTGDSARYLPWVEYLGCYGLKTRRKLIMDSITVDPGTQLNGCLLHCKQFIFIGLQQSKCVCLNYLKLAGDYLENPCNTSPATCQKDQTAFCGSSKTRYISNAFSIYQKVNVTEKLEDGNCLAVDRLTNSLHYVARNCSAKYFQICMNVSSISKSFHQQKVISGTWIDSFQLCKPYYMLSRYSLVAYNSSFSKGTYWLSNTRRWIEGTFTNPEFCIAARVKEDGSLERFPLRCERKLPGLCVSREVTTKHVSPSDDHAPIDKVLLISVIVATGFIILVATVIVILCIRRTSTRTERQPTLVLQNEVFYENESNILRRNQAANDTLDHMHYQSLNQNPIDSSNYNILHNVEVEITSHSQPQNTTGETAEQRQIEADYQEIENVSI